jgi:hypothetical protein
MAIVTSASAMPAATSLSSEQLAGEAVLASRRIGKHKG